MVKNPPANAGDTRRGFDSESVRFSEGGHGNPLQYSCLENPTDREAWWATVCGIAKSQHNRVTNTSILLPVDKCWHKLLVAYLEYSLSLDEAHAGSREWQALTQEALRA